MTSAPPTYQDPTRLHRTHHAIVSWIAIAVAAGADLAALYSVLALLFRADPVIVGVGTAGLLAACLCTAHHAGVITAQLRCGDRHANRAVRNSIVAAWLGLGVGCLAARALLPATAVTGFGAPPAAGMQLRDLLVGLLFFAVHIASGLAAMARGLHDHNPFVNALRAATTERRTAAKREARAWAQLVRTRHVLQQHQNERDREHADWQSARARVLADLAGLQHLARVLMATALQEPATTDALTRSRPEHPLLHAAPPLPIAPEEKP